MMKNNFQQFIKQFSIFIFFLAVITYLLQAYAERVPVSPYWPFILGFLYVFTLFLYKQLADQFSNKLSRFTNALMLVNFGKMMLYTAIILIVAWFQRDQALSFSLTFLVYYFLITFFEIRALLRLK